MSDDLEHVRLARARWEQGLLSKTLAKSPERRERFETVSGREVDRLYMPEAPAGQAYLEQLGFPGEYRGN